MDFEIFFSGYGNLSLDISTLHFVSDDRTTFSEVICQSLTWKTYQWRIAFMNGTRNIATVAPFILFNNAQRKLFTLYRMSDQMTYKGTVMRIHC